MKNKTKKVGVGSQNPTKINSTKKAFEKVWPNLDWEIISIDVDSGVSEQPMSTDETILGARTRAKNVMKKEDCDFAAGLEGGLCKIDDAYYNIAWIAVLDEEGKEGIGSTFGVQLPESMMDMIRDGQELGDVIDEVFDGKDLSKGQGFFGLMTNGLVDRTDGYVDGVISALSRFIHDDLFE